MSNNLIIQNNVIIGFDDEFVEEIVIPEGTTKIANGALKKYYGLKRIVFPLSLTTIGESAFEKCSSLESLVLPESLITIGEGAFASCSNLTSIYCKPIIPPTGYWRMFDYDFIKIYVPTESVEAYKSASYWVDYASAIVGYDF